jgi:hypothetical protein
LFVVVLLARALFFVGRLFGVWRCFRFLFVSAVSAVVVALVWLFGLDVSVAFEVF